MVSYLCHVRVQLTALPHKQEELGSLKENRPLVAFILSTRNEQIFNGTGSSH